MRTKVKHNFQLVKRQLCYCTVHHRHDTSRSYWDPKGACYGAAVCSAKIAARTCRMATSSAANAAPPFRVSVEAVALPCQRKMPFAPGAGHASILEHPRLTALSPEHRLLPLN